MKIKRNTIRIEWRFVTIPILIGKSAAPSILFRDPAHGLNANPAAGDIRKIRHVLYNCPASCSKIEGKTDRGNFRMTGWRIRVMMKENR